MHMSLLIVVILCMSFYCIKSLHTSRLSSSIMMKSVSAYRSSSSVVMSYSRVLTDAEMNALIQRVDENNQVPDYLNREAGGKYVPFVFKGEAYGYLQNDFVNKFVHNFPQVFDLSRFETAKELKFTDVLESIDDVDDGLKLRTDALHSVNLYLKNENLVKGWRDEFLAVVNSFDSKPICLVERCCYSYFAFKGYGIHVNGFVIDESKEEDDAERVKLWVAQRSFTKSTWPGLLDHIVAGGQPYGISPVQNVIKECAEEANIPQHLASRAKSVGAVSYISTDELNNIKRDALFVYDLRLPMTFLPTPVDGEVQKFTLMNIEQVIALCTHNYAGEEKSEYPYHYKPNCNLVVIDFLIRHGIINSQSSRYLELVGKLRTASCL